MKVISTLALAHDEWLEQRRKGIGGSDVAGILGVSKWSSPIKVYMDKIGELPPVEDNEAMYWGRVQEEIVAKEFELRSGMKVRRSNVIHQHPKYPWMLANVDRLIIGQKAGLECKTASSYLLDAWEGDQVPDAYLLQCMHYMEVLGYDEWWIAVLIGGNRFVYKKIERDQELIDFIVQKEAEFWQRVENRTPPDFDGSEASGVLLSKLYPQSVDGEVALLNPEEDEWIKAYLSAKQEIKTVEERLTLAENHLKGLMGECEFARCGEFEIKWKTQKSNRIDTKTLQADMPEIYKKYLKESISRPFKVKA